MADDVAGYSGTRARASDSDSESDKAPSTGRLPAPAGSRVHFAHGPSVLHWHAGCGCAPSPEKNSIAVCDAIPSDPEVHVPVVAAPPQAVTKTPASRWFSPNVQHRPPSLRCSLRACLR